MMSFHFIRPWGLCALIPLLVIAIVVLRQSPKQSAWQEVCDAHLLAHLIQMKGVRRCHFSWALLLVSAIFMIISLAGPSWSRLPVPSYKQLQARVVVLDMSDSMSLNDLTPDRLTRAKFKLHDLFQHQDVGQFALVVYTGEPFVVSPLTDDGKTIDALLSSLNSDIMPIPGQQLADALQQAAQLIHQAGFQQGQILVLTATKPATTAISTAKALAKEGIETSVMPVLSAALSDDGAFKAFAQAGQGQWIAFSDTSKDIDQWLSRKNAPHYQSSEQNDIPLWRDEGRWFLIPALLLLLPTWRRGWLQRISR